MIYRLVVANSTFVIGESDVIGRPFKLYTYEHLGIKDLDSWKNLLRIHLYDERIVLIEKEDHGVKYYAQKGTRLTYAASDVLQLVQSKNYQFKRIGEEMILYKPPSGQVLDENDDSFNYDVVIANISQNYILVSK